MGAILACVGPQQPQARHAALARMQAQASGRGAAQCWSGKHLQLCVLIREGDALLVVCEQVVIAVHGRVFDAQASAPRWLGADEVLLLWRRHSHRLAEHLGGNFSLLLHEPHRDHTVLHASAAGVNTLHLSRRGAAWCVATTPWQALAGADLPRTVDADALARHVLGQPRSDDSCFIGVQRLGALQQWQIAADGRVRKGRLDPLPQPDPRLGLRDACAELDVELRRVLSLQAQLPGSGLAVSAGLDSGNLLLRLPAQASANALTLAFAAPHDESVAAARLCALREVRHRILPVDEVAARAALAQLVTVAQAPVHCGALCNVLLAQAVHDDGGTRIMLGSGGDELFLFHPCEWRSIRTDLLRGLATWCDAMRLRPALGLSKRRGFSDILQSLLRRRSAPAVLHPGLEHHLLDSAGAVLERVYAAHGLDVEVPFYAPGVLALARRLPDLLRIEGGHPKAILQGAFHAALTDDQQIRPPSAPQFLPNWLHNLQIDEFFDNCLDQRPALRARRAFLEVAERVGWCQPRSMALQDAAVRRWGVTGAARRLSSAAVFARSQLDSREHNDQRSMRFAMHIKSNPRDEQTPVVSRRAYEAPSFVISDLQAAVLGGGGGSGDVDTAATGYE